MLNKVIHHARNREYMSGKGCGVLPIGLASLQKAAKTLQIQA